MELWHIYLGVGISSISAAILSPAFKAAVSDLVSEERYSQASGLIQLASSAQYLISPLVAGFLLSAFDIQLVLLIDMMTFPLAVGAVLIIMKQDATPQKHDRQSFFCEMSEAFRYLLSKTLGIALSVSASGMLVSSLLIGLFGMGKSKVLMLSFSLVLADGWVKRSGRSSERERAEGLAFRLFSLAYLLPFSEL
ncbi:MFS transporter [Brevibacillus brevis]|uniref:MFS transporter n=2 Tax=Brevibacillus TaxID=55080 RepID=UPI001FD4719B|nr:MFS transporter [Brevibacillus brevis]